VRLAYADPPYPGQAKRHYADHPDYAGEVNHVNLVARLGEYDGWALSTSAAALQEILALCPPDIRVGVWHRTNSVHPGNRGKWWWSWEPVIFKSVRPPAHPTRDVLSLPTNQGFLGNTITGEKPQPFCKWLFSLLGASPLDELDDLFPGSGAVGQAWEAWRSQLVLR
jgi:hypothetical protein